ncbi:RNA polymerase sigma-54 factor [Marinithermofilum abyssi]|uniref:RNA polymerase sigma-54 factor n=1 Tax=Marinithermofilum abyssi TaxID=1571185 RepID=A0A8J2YBJ7_9BACL|nr:RNA polymerase factor sigma-54 [Marinithermofilum abyssi]GGE04122.1 RNA polymerase sigma-54 factor [Marinithermofilum abyssi]
MALSMGYGLMQEQRMKLVMTPELRQAIEILQYSATDLLQYIQEQVMENPVLEMEESGADTKTDSPVSSVEENMLDWTRYLRDYQWNGTSVGKGEEKDNPVERLATSTESLGEVLEAQLRLLDLDSRTREVCSYIIGNLDEHGYVTVKSDQICKRFQLGREELEQCFHLVHSLDPAGVGARSLSECLRIQLSREDEPDELALRLVESCLTDVAEGRLKKVARKLDVSVAEVQQSLDRIKRLNPRPGLLYSGENPRYVVPDVTVEWVNEDFVILVNDGYIPRLGISRHYESILRRQDENARQAAGYIKDRMQSALWLMKSIEQRKQTLYRVTEAILQEQRPFFEHGTSHLKPLTLKQVAESLDLHESTVSRATQHKYLQTPRGLFPYRFFFPSGVSTQAGGNTSARSVKERIAKMVAEEDKCRPLSDQMIANRLKEEGVKISRRTVAKYREELGIAASKVRKRYEE